MHRYIKITLAIVALAFTAAIVLEIMDFNRRPRWENVLIVRLPEPFQYNKPYMLELNNDPKGNVIVSVYDGTTIVISTGTMAELK